MADDRQWMYDGWDTSGGKAHSTEWRRKTHDFINHAFSLTTHYRVKCPCNKHNNGKFWTRDELAKDLVDYGFMPGYETWTFYGEKETRVETEGEADDDSAGVDRMNEMLEALQPEFGLNSEDPPTKEVEELFKLLKSSEELLHEYKFFLLTNYYRVDPSQQDYADKVLDQAAKKICKDLFSNLRLQITNAWLKSQGQPLGCFRDCSEMYLTAEEYGHIGHPLFEDQAVPYKALCELWASEEFQERSKKHRNAGTKNATDKLGGDGYGRKAQRTAAMTREEPSAIDMYVMAHRGPDLSKPELLCTLLATERLEEYGKEMVRLHGEGFDWRNASVDAQAVYNSGGGKTHGRYSMFNVMTDSRQVQRGFFSQSSGGSSSRQRRTMSDMEIERLNKELERRDAFLKAQHEYQREREAYSDYVNAQQMAAIQATFQQQGLNFVMPQVRPLPAPPQWEMFSQMSFSPSAQGSGVQASNSYQTPPLGSGQHGDEQSGQHLDFVNNLFASGGSGHNSNE